MRFLLQLCCCGIYTLALASKRYPTFDAESTAIGSQELGCRILLEEDLEHQWLAATAFLSDHVPCGLQVFEPWCESTAFEGFFTGIVAKQAGSTIDCISAVSAGTTGNLNLGLSVMLGPSLHLDPLSVLSHCAR